MSEKYSVPALHRADSILNLICSEPSKFGLSDLSKKLNISKSTMHSLLQTMERLNWLERNANDTYTLGKRIAEFGSGYFSQFDLIEEFRRKAVRVMQNLQESIQLARLDGRDILYLAKVEAPSPVQMILGPGVRMPAHATALGKSLMAGLSDEQIVSILTEEQLPRLTENTISTRSAFLREIHDVRTKGFATDLQECVMGFCCVSSAIRRKNGEIVAAISCSMPIHNWDEKKEEAARQIMELAQELTPPN